MTTSANTGKSGNHSASAMRRALLAAAGELRREGDEASVPFAPGEDFPGFQGHFPGYPLLPAMVQIMAAEVAAGLWLGTDAALTGVSRAKFVREVRPGEQIVVSLSPAKGGKILARLFVGEEPASSMLLILETPVDGGPA